MVQQFYGEASEMGEDILFRCARVGVGFEVGGHWSPVLEDVSLSVGAGEFLSILGASGTGKTTLLRVLGGLAATTPGSSVQFLGKEISGTPEGIVIVFQNYSASLLPWRTVGKNVSLGIEGKFTASECASMVLEVLNLVGLSHRINDYPWRLSGGQQQRVQIARAIVMKPKVLLMDEPFGALDAMTKAQLQDGLLTLQQVTGATIIFVTHDIDEAIYLSDRVLVLSGSPARVAMEKSIDLPRPRDQMVTKEDPRYLRLRHEIHEFLRAGPENVN